MRQAVRSKARSGLEDGEDLSFGNHVIEADQDRFECARGRGEATGISIFMASTNAMSSPSPMLAPTSTGSAQTRPATSVTILMSGISVLRDTTARHDMRAIGRGGFLLWPQIA